MTLDYLSIISDETSRIVNAYRTRSITQRFHGPIAGRSARLPDTWRGRIT